MGLLSKIGVGGGLVSAIFGAVMLLKEPAEPFGRDTCVPEHFLAHCAERGADDFAELWQLDAIGTFPFRGEHEKIRESTKNELFDLYRNYDLSLLKDGLCNFLLHAGRERFFDNNSEGCSYNGTIESLGTWARYYNTEEDFTLELYGKENVLRLLYPYPLGEEMKVQLYTAYRAVFPFHCPVIVPDRLVDEIVISPDEGIYDGFMGVLNMVEGMRLGFF